jgi:hypothetical protein
MTHEEWADAEALAHKIAGLAAAEETPVPIFAEALCAVIGGIVLLAAPEDRERVINQFATDVRAFISPGSNRTWQQIAAAWRGNLQ